MATHSGATNDRPMGRIIGTIGPRDRPTAPQGPAPGALGSDERHHDWFPNVDVAWRQNTLVVTAALPGLNKDDVSVKVSREYLIIEGHQLPTPDDTRDGYRHDTRSGTPFKRTIVLPDGADTRGAHARLADGRLEVTIPLSPAEATSRPLALG